MLEEEKSVMLFHRSYRTLPGSLLQFTVEFICFTMLFSSITLYYYPQITFFMCAITQQAISPFFPPNAIGISAVDYISVTNRIAQIFFLDLPNQTPTWLFSLINLLVCLFFILVLPHVKRAKPLVILGILISIIHLVSSCFLFLIPNAFPYNTVDYSKLYMQQEINIWFFVPVVMGLAILPLPSSLASKTITMIASYLTALVFGTVRYAVFLFILAKFSIIYMAIFFFVLGPLMDYTYIVGIYSWHISRQSTMMEGDFKLWKWPF